MSADKKSLSVGGVDLVAVIIPFAKIFWEVITEIYYSIKFKSMPWADCLSVACAVAWLIYFDVDYWIEKKLHIGFIHPDKTWIFRLYCFCALSSGFLVHGFFQYLRRSKVQRKVEPVLLEAGLQNRTGKFPRVVGEWQIEEQVFRLRLTKQNIPLSRFQSGSETLATRLGFIETITENRLMETVDILYSRIEMPKVIPFVDKMKRDTILVGRTRTRAVWLDFNEIPHILIGGETTGGKSTFIRQLVASLFLNDDTANFVLIDLKEGGEAGICEGVPRFEVHSNPENAAKALDRLTPLLQQRMELFRANQVPDRTAYLKIPAKDRVGTPKISARDPIGRYFVVVDEAQLLFNCGPRLSANATQKARAAANLFTQQGRAVGIHIIVATQRPDVKAVDSHTKTNLGGQLCFGMNNAQSSISVIGTGRACEIPKDRKGRAIWKYGSEIFEVQTPYLSFDEAKAIYKQHMKPQKKEEVVPADEATEKVADFSLVGTIIKRGA
jgi:hypothetical protein